MNCYKNCNSCKYAAIGKCGFFCKLGRTIKKAAQSVNDWGLLPPGFNQLLQAGGNLLGAGNTDAPPQPPTAAQQERKQLIKNNQLGNIPKVFYYGKKK